MEYIILDAGGLMTADHLKRHNSTIEHFNRLVTLLPTKKEGTTEYLNIVNKLRTLQAYIERDLRDAGLRADKLMKN